MLLAHTQRKWQVLARLAAAVAALLASRAGLAEEHHWSFETGRDGWRNIGCSTRRSDAGAHAGSWSLAVSRTFPGCATIELRFPRRERLDVSETPRLRYRVFAPRAAGTALRTLFFLKNKDGLWYQCVRHLPLYPGRWTEVEFDLSPSSSQVEPVGHFRRWSNSAAAEIETIGIKFFSQRGFQGTVLVDAIDISEADDAERGPLAITDFQAGAARVPQFAKLELTFDINRSYQNPFDPDIITVDAEFRDPDGEKVTVPAFHYQDFVRVDRARRVEKSRLLEDLVPVGGGCWKVRFAPAKAGLYSYVLKVVDNAGRRKETLTTRPRRFRCVPSSRRGYVRVAADRRHFEFSTGQPFYPIGHNVHSSNDVSDRNLRLLNLQPQGGPRRRGKVGPQDDRGTKAYETIFAKMAAHGENLAEVWMASWSLELEWTDRWRHYFGLGRYNLHHAWKLDRILAIAERHGIYIHLVLDNHGALSTFSDPEWDDNPYNEENGGFLADCKDYFSRLMARRWYRRKLRYIIARWGYSTRIMGFELWSEIDLTGNTWNDHQNPRFLNAKVAWHREMTRHIKKIDHGRHLLTTHYSGTYARVQAPLVQLPGIDYIALDAYRSGGRTRTGHKSIVHLFEKTSRRLRIYGKPILVTEYGGSPKVKYATLERMEADLHAGIWSAYMMDHAGTPLLWWFMYIDRENKYGHYKALANFAKGEDRRNRGLETVKPMVSGAQSPVSCLALKNDRSAYMWVYDEQSAREMPPRGREIEHRDTAVSLDGFRNGPYTVEFWDTYAGRLIRKVPMTTKNGRLTLRIPAFKNDIAVKIKPFTGRRSRLRK